MSEKNEKRNQWRVMVAEELGWTSIDPVILYGRIPENRTDGSRYQHLPDWPNDLNEMHEAESHLTEKEGGDYDMFLWLIIKRDGTRPASWHSSATQKVEAFLCMKGRIKFNQLEN